MKRLWIALSCLLAASLALGAECKVEIPRTPRNVTEAQKRAVYAKAGHPCLKMARIVRYPGEQKRESYWSCPKGWVVDHRLPLELGGTNQDANLTLQSVSESRAKDRIENCLAADVCHGLIPLRWAQREIRHWKTVKCGPKASKIVLGSKTS